MTTNTVLSCELCAWWGVKTEASWAGKAPDGQTYVVCDEHGRDPTIRLRDRHLMTQAERDLRSARPDIFQRSLRWRRNR